MKLGEEIPNLLPVLVFFAGFPKVMKSNKIKNRERIDNLDEFYSVTGCSLIGFLTS